MKEFTFILVLIMCLFSAWIVATPKIKTGFFCTTGFALMSLGFAGATSVLWAEEFYFLYRALMFITIGLCLIAFSFLIQWAKIGKPPRRTTDWVIQLDRRSH
jgi:hypothetical protein